MSEEIPPLTDSLERGSLITPNNESQTPLPGFLTELETPDTDSQDELDNDHDAPLFASLGFHPLHPPQDSETPRYGDLYKPHAYTQAVLTSFPNEEANTYEIYMIAKPPVATMDDSAEDTKQLLLNEYNILTRSFTMRCISTSGDKAVPPSHAFRCASFQDCDYCWDIHESACHVLKTFRDFIPDSEYRRLYFS